MPHDQTDEDLMWVGANDGCHEDVDPPLWLGLLAAGFIVTVLSLLAYALWPPVAS